MTLQGRPSLQPRSAKKQRERGDTVRVDKAINFIIYSPTPDTFFLRYLHVILSVSAAPVIFGDARSHESQDKETSSEAVPNDPQTKLDFL